ncbi:MAG: S8 family serine peptidase, partial [Myxococcota bacterium]
GNEGSDTVAYPARFPEVIAVGAATLERDADGMTAATAKYSNRGGALDLVAFGGRMDQDVDGDGVADGILGDRPATKWGAAGPYLTEGTSPAAAQVSGAAAILIARGADAARVRRILVETASRGGVATELFNVDRGAGVLNVGYAVESLVTNAAPFANFAPTFANALLVFEQAAGDLVRPSVIVEVTDDAGVRLANYHVFGQFGGIADEVVHARTDGMGIAVIRGKEAVDPDLGAVTFTVDAVASVPNRHFSRPTGQIDVESLSYALLSNFGAGLASSAIVLDFSPDALARVPYLDISRLAPSYAIRSVGAGLASSALVMAVSPTYYQVSDLARTTLLFRSQGVGLASSAIVLDPVFFSVAYRPQLGLQTVTVRNYVTGSGLASSALIASTGRLPYDAYFTGRNPTVWLMTTGAGLASSAIIFDEAGMLNRDLTVTSSLATWDAGLPAGHGDATSTRLAPYTATTVSTVGQNWSQVSARYPQGSGLASSALISIYNPYIYLRTSSPELLTTRTVIVGQGRTAVPFAAP